MREVESAALFAIALAKKRGLLEVTPDELLLGCLQTISQFGIVRVGALLLDLEELGIDWLQPLAKSGTKVTYSRAVVALFDQAAGIARSDDSGPVRIEHLLAAFSREDSGLMGELKGKHGITSGSWRAAVGELGLSRLQRDHERGEERHRKESRRDYFSPEEAADALGVHVQTVRAYVRSGKLPALRVAGERAIRIRRSDLDAVLEPVTPQE